MKTKKIGRTEYIIDGSYNRYESFVKLPQTILLLRQLNVCDKDKCNSDKDAAIFTSDDIPGFNSGVAHGLNTVFVAGRMPFFAKMRSINRAVYVFRINLTFEETNYATRNSYESFKATGIGSKSQTHFNEPLTAQIDRMLAWKDSFAIDFEKNPVDEQEALQEISKIPKSLIFAIEENFKLFQKAFAKDGVALK